ncbi:MAG: HDOD domain-containing protein [Gammaproteobacteria bacterium]
MAVTAESLLKNVSGLVSLPEVAMRVNAMVDDATCTADEVARVIETDPGLSTRVLGIANSAMYGYSREISTVHRAVMVLGTRQIRDLVLTTAAAQAFEHIPTNLISVDDFWHHSIYCGLLAKQIAAMTQTPHAETMFMAGLLHDIGHLIMFNQLPEQIHQILLETLQPEAEQLYQIERRVLGFDHAEVGGALARLWTLPPVLQEVIAFHHEPDRAQQFPQEVFLIHIANRVAALPYTEYTDSDWLQMFSPEVLTRAGISHAQLQTAVLTALEEENSVRQLLFG